VGCDLQSVAYAIVRVSERQLWLERESDKRIFVAAYFANNWQILATDLPKEAQDGAGAYL
jgi:hypothetical protein